jgi:hypothetical protein
MSNSDIEQYIKRLDDNTKAIKDEVFRISWYMRGGVSSHDLLHVYSVEDRKIMGEIIKENIETTKQSRIAII